MSYTFNMGSFMNDLMYYATTMFTVLIPIGAITAGIAFGVGLVLLVTNMVKGSIRSM